MTDKPNNQGALKKGTEPPLRAEKPVQPQPKPATPAPKSEPTPKTFPPKK